MEIIEFLGGPGLFLLLAILVVVVVVYSKFKNRR
ncbi:hypothetical protein C8D94_101292 [Marinirhabdus gelatinilytica]|uniref:Uncharacterized protein n=1 Tax=Marinirhabdus gelatinilytica TaxID=1703343 RepID=A0A370QK32_9FLAO|nr:hypothetical protein C8D94_101292 [Marinirhabdus gelatinilytica]